MKIIIANLNGITKEYKHHSLLVMDINKELTTKKHINDSTLATYFTPSNLKSWNLPKWLKNKIVSVQINNTLYTSKGFYNVK